MRVDEILDLDEDCPAESIHANSSSCHKSWEPPGPSMPYHVFS
jgi:hypothetical protein